MILQGGGVHDEENEDEERGGAPQEGGPKSPPAFGVAGNSKQGPTPWVKPICTPLEVEWQKSDQTRTR